MIKSSRLVGLFSFGLVAFGGVTALKSNDLSNIKIFTYQMKPIVSPGDRQYVAEENVQKKADKVVAEIQKEAISVPQKTLPAITKTTYIKDAPDTGKLLNEKQSFFLLEKDLLARPQQSQPYLPSYRVASSAPMNIIPDYSRPKEFSRSYKRLVMGKGVKATAMRQTTRSYRGAVRQNGPVMLRPIVTSREAVRQISTARLPISSAKPVKESITAMR